MAPIRPKAPPETGQGVLVFAGRKEAVDYEVEGAIASLKPGGPAVKAAVKTTSEIAREAFRAGEVTLQAADDKKYRLRIVAHSEGSGVAYGELKI